MAGRLFSELPAISPETLAVLSAQGFERATPVQEATIPLFAGNKDVAVDAATGSGKTLAFVVPIVEKMRRLEEPLKKHQVRGVVSRYKRRAGLRGDMRDMPPPAGSLLQEAASPPSPHPLAPRLPRRSAR